LEKAMKTHFDTGGSIPELAFLAIGGAMLAGAILYSTMGPVAGVLGAALGGLGGAVLGLI
jgi:hypothetical protein